MRSEKISSFRDGWNRPDLEKPNFNHVAAAVFALFVTTDSWASAECLANAWASTDSKALKQVVTSTVLNPRRSEISLKAKVEPKAYADADSPWIIDVRSRGFRSWECNFSTVKSESGELKLVTAKHCVNEEFGWVAKDYWESTSFSKAPLYVRILERVGKIMDIGSVPELGAMVSVTGCISRTGKCFRIEWTYDVLYSKGAENVYGIWIASSEYGKMAGENSYASLSWLSGSPVTNSEWKVFWTVSATISADFRKLPDGSCVVANHAVALAIMPEEDENDRRRNLARE